MSGPGPRGAAAAVALLLLVPFRPAAAPPELRGLDSLVRVYDDILDARFDQVDPGLQRACGPGASPAPKEACDVLGATAIWWRILLDPDNRSLDDELTAAAEKAIASTEAWIARDPRSAEAQFYNGAAYAVRVQWRVLRDQKLSAARDGKRIKQALERAIALDGDLDDAYFGLGMYKYYADVAPTAAKVLRFLLLLPGGDRTEGLAEMLRARSQGRLLQGEADYQLQIIYLWYEHRVNQAVALLEALRERYPGNPHFLAQLATVRDVYQHDIPGSLALWRELLAAAREQRVNEPALAETQARLAIARQLDTLYQTDHALEQLRAVIDARATRPFGALGEAYLAFGEGEDRLGHRDAAVAAYRLAISTAATPDARDVRGHAAGRLQHAPNARRAEAYRTALEGFRRLERSDVSTAQSLLAHSLTLDPGDPVARYRYGLVLLLKKDEAGALTQFEQTIANAKACPGPIAASAYLEAARAHERLGHRAQAIGYYRAAQQWFGGGSDTRAAATRALSRLRAPR